MAYKVGRSLLRDLLKRNDLEQVDLAHKLNVTKQQVNKYVLDQRKMSLEVAKNISHILGCAIEELYDWEWIDEEGNE